MTIKRRWKTRLPVVGVEIPRVRTLKPGHIESVAMGGVDEFGYPFESEYILKVVSDDEIALQDPSGRLVADRESFERYFRGEIPEDQIKRVPAGRFVEKEGVNVNLLNPNYRETLHQFKKPGIFNQSVLGKEMQIEWEPTLPSQARK